MVTYIGFERPVCAGALLMTPRGMEAFYDYLCQSLWRPGAGPEASARLCNDQGALNVWVYHDHAQGPHRNVPLLVQRRGVSMVVNHVGQVLPRSRITDYRSAEGYVLNDDGTRSPVVHQHTRFRPLITWADRLAKGGNMTQPIRRSQPRRTPGSISRSHQKATNK